MDLKIAAVHRRRLREVWRSAGWPCQDVVEAELIAAGLLARRFDAQQRVTLQLTDAGIGVIAETVQRHRDARSLHEQLVERVAREMQRAGRLAWCGLALRAPPLQASSRIWPLVMPDVFSIRNTSVEDYVEPIVHEIKVHRADLLSDLRNLAKREAYRALASQCWYVLRQGIGDAADVPLEYGVMLAHPHSMEVARPAPARAMRLPFMTWMALARGTPLRPADEAAQGWLKPAQPSDGSA